MDCWPEVALSSWLWALPMVQLTARPHASSPLAGRRAGGVDKTETTIPTSLTSEVTSHLLCYILFIRSKSLSPAHSQKERITQGHESQEKGVIGNHFRGFLARLFVTAASLPYYTKSDGAVCIAGVAEHFEHFCMNILPTLPAYSWE